MAHRRCQAGDATSGSAASATELGRRSSAAADSARTSRIRRPGDVTLGGSPTTGELTGTLVVHSAGDDGRTSNFWGVAPYSVRSPAGREPASASPASAGRIAVDPRPDHQPDEDHAEQRLLDHDLRHGKQQPAFPLPATPSAAGEPGRDSFYDNMWRSSTELFYVMYKVGD